MNNRKRKISIWMLTMVLLGVICLSLLKLDAKAGFGDFNDYSSGDSGGDYGSDYSSWDTEWDSSFDGDGYSISLRHRGILPVAVTVTLLFAIFMRMFVRKQMRDIIKTRQSSSSGGKKGILPDRTDEISRIIQEREGYFTAPDFLSFARQVYMDIQFAWEKRDLTSVSGVLHRNLYQQTNRQIQKKIEDGIVNHLERISVNTAYLTSYRRDKEYEYLTIYLAASMIDYQVREATGEVLLGDKTTRWNLEYKMTFMRSVNARTKSAKEADRGFVCPNCGAPLKGTSFGKCEYCDSIVTTGTYDWVLSGFGVVKNDTVDEGIKVN